MAKKLTIGYDASVTLAPRPGGIARYTRELLRALVALDAPDLHFVVLLNSLRHRGGAFHRWLAARPNVTLVSRRLPGPLLVQGWKRFGAPTWETLTGRPCDVVHAPASYIPPTRAPFVVTVHDLAFLRDKGGDALAGGYFAEAFAASLGNAARILTPSRHVALEIARIYGIPEIRIQAVHSGLSNRRFHLLDGVERRGVLAVTDAGIERKRAEWIGPVCEPIAREYKKRFGRMLPIYVVGMSGSRPRSLLRLLPRVGDAELARLYARAEVTLLTTREEGFGFPLLESLACGTPVVCGNHSSLAEIGGEFAHFAERDVASSFTRKLGEAIFHPPENEWREAASAYAHSFTWERCARQVAEAYRAVVEE